MVIDGGKNQMGKKKMTRGEGGGGIQLSHFANGEGGFLCTFILSLPRLSTKCPV